METKSAIVLDDPEEIGCGAYGKVFKGKYRGVEYAVKRRYVEESAPQGCVHVGEIDCLTRFRHPHIIRSKAIQRINPIGDNFRSDKNNTYGSTVGRNYRADLAYVITEAADADLWKIVRDPCSTGTIRKWMWQLLSALHYIHKNGFIHRDVKPQNILYFSSTDSIKLCDFDMCMPNVEGMESFKAMTPEYTPPEILLQGVEVLYTEKVDIWGAGLVMKFLSSGDSIVKRCSNKDDVDDHILALHQRYFPNGKDHVTRDMSNINLNGENIVLKTGNADMDDLLYHMIDCDLNARWTAEQCLSHKFFTGMTVPNVEVTTDFFMETHNISHDMAKVFDGELGSMNERTWFGFFLGLDILARVCRTKYTGNQKNLAICCFNIGMKYYDKETARTIPIDAKDAKEIEYRVIVEKLQGEVYRDLVYNHIRGNPLRLYAYLISRKVYGRKFSEIVSGIKYHLEKKE